MPMLQWLHFVYLKMISQWQSLKPKVTSSGGKFDLAALTDGDLAKSTFLPAAPPNGKSWIQFEFSKPETIQSITIVARDKGGEKSTGS